MGAGRRLWAGDPDLSLHTLLVPAPTSMCQHHPQVHLLVDTTLTDNQFSIKAFQSRLLTLGDKVLGTEFVEVPCEVLFGEAEKVSTGNNQL